MMNGERASSNFESNDSFIQMSTTKLLIYEPPADDRVNSVYDELKRGSWKDVEYAPMMACGGIGQAPDD